MGLIFPSGHHRRASEPYCCHRPNTIVLYYEIYRNDHKTVARQVCIFSFLYSVGNISVHIEKDEEKDNEKV